METGLKRISTAVLVSVVVVGAMLGTWQGRVGAQAGADLYIRDTPSDTGIEPNPDAGPMWVSDDIWVRRSADPNYDPHPFNAASPSWTPAPHEDPLYRSYRKAVPNYVYVRVINRGSSASTGTERLKVNWARASTGLTWPAQWVDNTATTCGAVRPFGAEITKPRINGATASDDDRARYVQAFLNIDNPPFDLAAMSTYWRVQKVIHSATGSGDGDIDVPQHFMETFLPWHRDFVNRLELLMQEADPNVKLMYWDWVTNPSASFGFMGGLTGTNAGGPFSSLPSFTRNLTIGNLPPTATNGNTLNKPWYLGAMPGNSPTNNSNGMRNYMENAAHGRAHLTIGADQNGFAAAAGDPFFFLIHGNADRLFARWQRQNLDRLVAPTLYQNAAAGLNLGTNPEMANREFKPWNGQGFGSAISPWNSPSDPLAVAKTSTDPSVVSPPMYDDAPLTIPVLNPGEAVVMQIPWYPPNPEDLACLGPNNLRHYCLLARIETNTTTPFGMTSVEGADVTANTRNNNNIAWRNVQVENEFGGPFKMAQVMLRNVFKQNTPTALRFTQLGEVPFSRQGTVQVVLPAVFVQQWVQNGQRGKGVKFNPRENAILIVDREAEITGLTLPPNVLVSVGLQFQLFKDYKPGPNSTPQVLVTQVGAPNNREQIIGGQTVRLDFRKLKLIPNADTWRFLDGNSKFPDQGWQKAGFDDSTWSLGRGSFGFGFPVETLLSEGNVQEPRTVMHFRKEFMVDDPSFMRQLWLRLKRDDGAIVYLNGREVLRSNLPEGDIGNQTLALKPVSGASAGTYYAFKLDPKRLQKGKNVIAVSVHQAKGERDETRRDLMFDLELIANPDTMQEAPTVEFAAPLDGTGWQSNEDKTIAVDVADGTGKLGAVRLFVDDKRIGERDNAPFIFKVPALEPGQHSVRVVASNANKLVAERRATVFVSKNTPPAVQITTPSNNQMLGAGERFKVAATASDVAPGSVKTIEVYVQRMERFDDEAKLVGTIEGDRGEVEVAGLEKGMYMVMVVAVDDAGLRSPTAVAHIHLH